MYLIECRDGSIYTGIAVDVAARYAAHLNGKGARYTRSHPPRCLLAVLEYPGPLQRIGRRACSQTTDTRRKARLCAVHRAGGLTLRFVISKPPQPIY